MKLSKEAENRMRKKLDAWIDKFNHHVKGLPLKSGKRENCKLCNRR